MELTSMDEVAAEMNKFLKKVRSERSIDTLDWLLGSDKTVVIAGKSHHATGFFQSFQNEMIHALIDTEPHNPPTRSPRGIKGSSPSKDDKKLWKSQNLSRKRRKTDR
jgi:hypothetical protein